VELIDFKSNHLFASIKQDQAGYRGWNTTLTSALNKNIKIKQKFKKLTR